MQNYIVGRQLDFERNSSLERQERQRKKLFDV